MILGLGLDVTEIDRIEAAIGRHGDAFKNRVYTPAERAYLKAGSFKFGVKVNSDTSVYCLYMRLMLRVTGSLCRRRYCNIPI